MIHVFYHGADLDGLSSGAIARYHFEDIKKEKIRMWPFNYGDNFPYSEINYGERVVMVDITKQPYEEMEKINSEYNLFVIDHHKTFIDHPISKDISGVFKVGTAACQLTWNYYFDNKPIPGIINLLGQYDVWKNDDKIEWEEKIMPMQMGMRMQAADPNTEEGYKFWKSYLSLHLSTNLSSLRIADRISDNGKVILEYQKMVDSKTINMYAFEAEFEGMESICMNSTHFSSQAFESIWDNTKYDIMVSWANVKGEYYTVSLYTDKDYIDVSEIAKKYGGGGHMQAAGFQCADINAIINSFGNKEIIVRKIAS